MQHSEGKAELEHLCCWCSYTQVRTSLSLNHIIHTLQVRFPKVKRTHQALGNGKREFKNKKTKKHTICPRESQQVPKAHSREIQKPSQGPPAFSRYEHRPRTLKTPQPFNSKSLTLLLIPLQRDTFPRRLEMAHNSTAVQHGSQEPSDGPPPDRGPWEPRRSVPAKYRRNPKA